ncbi:hypothetical protein ACH5RR_014106 [Cinchona calisaya]|uniref:Dof zinc finger protein n=1 Tax=Cinchona calisaya TaxID=153742 RepID=A0ABD3A1Y2_9GENT
MPSADSIERRGTKANQVVGSGAVPPSEPEVQLQCPRCDSNNTKFCYYNNYNFSQPRHFCKSCRRYWTHGGTLRDIPVGGGSRKNAKRSRTVASFSSSTSTYEHRHTPAIPSPLLAPVAVDDGGQVAFLGDVKNGLNASCGTGSFTSLLNTGGHGLLALGGFGLEDMGFGLGRAVWPFPGLGVGDGDGGASGVGGPSVLGNTWQLQNGEAGNCFTWSDVAISTIGHVMK